MCRKRTGYAAVDGQSNEQIEAQFAFDEEQYQLHSDSINAEYAEMRKERDAYDEEQSRIARERNRDAYYRC
jgi:hypothetical protein